MSETSCEMITRALHARDPSAMVFAGHAVMALDELRATLTARESELAEAQQRLNEVANAQRNACTTECIDGVWWALGVGIVAGPQATEQDVLLEVAENWWRVAAAAQRRVAELEANGANVEWLLQSLVWSCPPETPVDEFKRHVDWLRGILLPPDRITHIPGKESDDGEMH